MTSDQPDPSTASDTEAGADLGTGRPASRRLILLRHAKSAWPDGVPDLERPLAERGIADATAAGAILAGLTTLTAADVVLCSPARRTRQTWRLVAQALPDPPPTRFEPLIYGAEVDELLDLVRSVPDEAANVLVIGHDPTMSQAGDALAGPGSDPADLARLRHKYPTCAIALYTLEPGIGWADLDVRRAALARFVVPRG